MKQPRTACGDGYEREKVQSEIRLLLIWHVLSFRILYSHSTNTNIENNIYTNLTLHCPHSDYMWTSSGQPDGIVIHSGGACSDCPVKNRHQLKCTKMKMVGFGFFLFSFFCSDYCLWKQAQLCFHLSQLHAFTCQQNYRI